MWRYKVEGLKGLAIRTGRGRPSILQTTDTESVRATIQKHRQRISQAKVELEESLGKEFSKKNFGAVFKKLNCRYKRIRKRLKQKELEEVYQHKREILGELETLGEKQIIDLYYADESRVSLEPLVPYGWQFPDENVFMPTTKGNGLNCFALLSRTN